MKSQIYFFSLLLLVLSTTMVFSGCKKDEPTNESNDNIKEVPDPEGTISVSLRNHANGHTSIYPGGCYGEGFSVFADGNFSCSQGTEFASVGKVTGVGNITSIPTSGWTKVLYASPGQGYVAAMVGSNGVGYVRLFVTDYMTSATTGGIMGIYLKYQSPFNGKAQSINLTKDPASNEITVSPDMSWSVSSNVAWCTPKITSRNTFQLVYDENIAYEVKQGIITVKSPGLKDVTYSVPPQQPLSPDFITFANGELPTACQTNSWVVDNTIGYDDSHSLKPTVSGGGVVISKTGSSNINMVEFYLKGTGTVSFYIDGEKKAECTSSSNWQRFCYYLPNGSHTLKWACNSIDVNLDAIKFKQGLAIGTPYEGGLITYLDNTNQHGLIAATEDQSTGIQWYNGSYIVTGATGTAIGTGQANTTAIVAAQGDGAYAAKLCDDLILNGYSDWFLPSKDEMNELYKNRNAININVPDAYWSSSEEFDDRAWQQNSGYTNYKNNTYRVRAFRAF